MNKIITLIVLAIVLAMPGVVYSSFGSRLVAGIFYLGKDANWWIYSTLAQSYAALIGVIAVFAVLQYQFLIKEIDDSSKNLKNAYENLDIDKMRPNTILNMTTKDLVKKVSSDIGRLKETIAVEQDNMVECDEMIAKCADVKKPIIKKMDGSGELTQVEILEKDKRDSEIRIKKEEESLAILNDRYKQFKTLYLSKRSKLEITRAVILYFLIGFLIITGLLIAVKCLEDTYYAFAGLIFVTIWTVGGSVVLLKFLSECLGEDYFNIHPLLEKANV